MGTVAKCCCEEVAVASFAQFEPFSQFCNGRGEVSNGQITLADVCQHPLQVFFREVAIVLYLEGSTWKILDEMGRSEQMTEGMKLFDIISFAKCVLYSSLQNRCVWFV